MNTDYQKQALDALAAVGATLEIVLTDTKSAPWEDSGAYRPHYRCKLTKGRRSHTFDFWDSIDAGRTGAVASPYDVLTSCEWYTAESFEDFCGDFGYDTDSRKGEKVWKACRAMTRALCRVIPDEAHRAILADVR